VPGRGDRVSPPPTPAPIDAARLAALARELVRIESVNPALEPGGSGELPVAQRLARELAELGLAVEIHEPAPGRATVVTRLRGAGGGRSLMLNSHLDTVGVAGMPEPFSGRIEGGRLHGRGAYDMKGSVAACVAALRSLSEAGITLAGDLVLAAVADEEHASLGTADLIRQVKVDGAIVTEPTSLRLCRAHKGFVWVEIETAGLAAHGSRFDLGVDANLAMGRVLGELSRLERELRDREPHPLVGPPSLHAATLHGGTGLSTYAASCRLQVERRTIPGESADLVVEELRRLVRDAGLGDPRFQAELRVLMVREPFETAAGLPLVTALERSAGVVLGEPPPHVGESFWMDAALLADAGIETVVFGPTGGGAHAADEWVELRSLELLAETLAHTAVAYCGVAAIR
jgi:acetylornithine deacetylase